MPKNMNLLTTCDGCDGCGRVTDDKYRLPWVWHTRELKDENGVSIASETQPVTCNKCNGCGRIPRHMVTYKSKKRMP